VEEVGWKKKDYVSEFLSEFDHSCFDPPQLQ
jgi:hypothetical protein